AWEKFLREQPPATRIEDRRGEQQPDISPEELAAGMARWNAIRRGYLKDYKLHPEGYNIAEQRDLEYKLRLQQNPLANYRKEYDKSRSSPPQGYNPSANYRKEYK